MAPEADQGLVDPWSWSFPQMSQAYTLLWSPNTYSSTAIKQFFPLGKHVTCHVKAGNLYHTNQLLKYWKVRSKRPIKDQVIQVILHVEGLEYVICEPQPDVNKPHDTSLTPSIIPGVLQKSLYRPGRISLKVDGKEEWSSPNFTLAGVVDVAASDIQPDPTEVAYESFKRQRQ